MIEFWTVATIIWLLLLAVLLRPLLYRSATVPPRKLISLKSRLAIGVLMAVFVIASSALLYVYWSEGYSVLIAASEPELDMVELTEQLADRLKQSPDNAEGWLLLASSYAALGQYDKSVAAYAQAEHYTELEAWAQLGYAEALLAAEGLLTVKAKRLIEAAMASSPDDPRGLFLIGLANLEEANYPQTIFYWERLLVLLEEDDALADAVNAKLVEVRALAAEMPAADQSLQPQDTTTEQSEKLPPNEPRLADGHCFMRINVVLSAELSLKVLPTDTLFVYAQASSGPPMPLAIKRFKAEVLPLETCLGPEDGMIEGMTIDSFDPIRVIARVSRSGSATPQAGDMQARSEAISATAGDAISLVINEVLE